MAEGRLVIRDEPRDGQHTLLLSGELDFTSADNLRDRIDAIRPEAERIVLDLSGIEFIDSAGLAQLVWAHSEARLKSWTLSIVRPPKRVLSYMRRTGLDRVLPIE